EPEASNTRIVSVLACAAAAAGSASCAIAGIRLNASRKRIMRAMSQIPVVCSKSVAARLAAGKLLLPAGRRPACRSDTCYDSLRWPLRPFAVVTKDSGFFSPPPRSNGQDKPQPGLESRFLLGAAAPFSCQGTADGSLSAQILVCSQ